MRARSRPHPANRQRRRPRWQPRRRRGGGTTAPPPPEDLPGDLAAICADAEARVVAYTGLRPAAPLPPPEALQRPGWIAANVNSMGALLDPIGDKLAGGGLLGGATRSAAGVLLSVEAGALTGYLSQRVLGQYEFALVDPDAPARLLFVAPNIAGAARKLDADAEQLLQWIAFHEVTHAVQFAGVPWLRPYLAGLLRDLLGSLEVKVDAARAAEDAVGVRRQGARRVAQARRARRRARPAAAGASCWTACRASWASSRATPSTSWTSSAPTRCPQLPELRAALTKRRQERSPLLAVLERLIGLEAKLRQYEDGKRFCDAVAAAAGPAGCTRCSTGRSSCRRPPSCRTRRRGCAAPAPRRRPDRRCLAQGALVGSSSALARGVTVSAGRFAFPNVLVLTGPRAGEHRLNRGRTPSGGSVAAWSTSHD